MLGWWHVLPTSISSVSCPLRGGRPRTTDSWEKLSFGVQTVLFSPECRSPGASVEFTVNTLEPVCRDG